jgi:hypothetical protein
MTDLAEEMPDTWVRELADAIETCGWTIADAHESAIVITLTDSARHALRADQDDRFLIVSWGHNSTHWGLSTDGVWAQGLQPCGGTTPAAIADRVHRILTCGRPEPRNLRHAVPYAAASEACTCPLAFPCGGIVPASGCPDHGDRKEPAMAWHWEAACHGAA